MTTSIPAPIHALFPVVAEWVTDRGADGLVGELRHSAVFSEQGFTSGTHELDELWETGAWISWLGGPAVDPGRWPINAAGEPLAHVATFHLGDVHALHAEGRRAWPAEQVQEALPRDGMLQVFHDLETDGQDAADAKDQSWLVQWLPDPERGGSRPALVAPPAQAHTPTSVCQPGVFMPSFSLPSPLDHRPGAAHSYRLHDELTEEVSASWSMQRGLKTVPGHSLPVTHVYGHSSSGAALPQDEVLPTVLPLEADDEHVLMLEIESWTALAGWFGDASSLEVWMRGSDLAERRFDRAWCMVRSD